MRRVVLLSLLVIAVGVFQNCSDTKLRPASTTKYSSVPPQNLGTLCAPSAVDVSLPQKIMLILDLSASNVAVFSKRGNSGSRNYWIGMAAYNKCVEETGGPGCYLPTDLPGNRFAATNIYLNTCPQNLNSSNSYGVIGFSNFPLQPKGFSTRSCEDPLVSKSVALQEVSGLLGVQNDDLAKGAQFDPGGYPYQMRDTSYTQAFSCLEKRILNDINPIALQKDYKVLFITDGKPSDGCPHRCEPNSSYINQLRSIQSFLQTQGYKMLFQPIFYGTALDPLEQADAITRLNEMANTITPGTSTIVLDSLNPDFTSQLSDQLCRTPVETLKVPYNIVNQLQFVPLTSYQEGTQIYSDQDMDGLNDDLEPLLGFDKTKSRSHDKILDSLCSLYQSACVSFEPTVVCDVNKPVGFGFSDCDAQFINQKILKVGDLPFGGLDYDGDNTLDYIELIKGTHPFVKDMDLNNDGDDYTNFQEIIQGTDPSSYTSAELIAKYQTVVSAQSVGGCAAGGKGLSLQAKQLPFVTVEASAENFLIPHSQDENIFAVIYYAKPTAIDTSRTKVFVGYIKFDKDKNVTLINPTEKGVIVQP